jgi:hypothetical protein
VLLREPLDTEQVSALAVSAQKGVKMSDYSADISKYTINVNANAVKAIVDYCAPALRSRDSSLVAASDPKELATVRNGFAAKKLGLAPEAADAGIKVVVDKMKGEHNKGRVTFYYLLAEATGTLAKLG